MRSLTAEEIKRLASRKGVKRIAVENFLSTMGDNAAIALYNLALDARLYKWNIQTIKAIEDGIKLASRGK